MDKKYYTPKPEEFRNGFTFEGKFNDGTWKEITLDLEDPALFTNLRHEIWSIENGFVRVKYLDKKDIESLGFEHFKWIKPFKRVYIGFNIFIMHDSENNTISTMIADPSKSVECAKTTIDPFKINKLVIKNRSELKDLLTKLNVEYNET